MKQTLNSLIAILFTSLSYIEKEVKNVLALGLMVTDDVMQVVLDGREFREKVDDKKFATEGRANYLKRVIPDATRSLVALQFRFLTSMQVKDELKSKLATLRPEVRDRCGKDIAAARSVFESIRGSKDPRLEDLRNAYLSLTGKIDAALKYQVQFTIDETLNPPKPRPVVRHKKHTPGTTKGMKGSEGPKYGGNGTSRDALRRQRRRARQKA